MFRDTVKQESPSIFRKHLDTDFHFTLLHSNYSFTISSNNFVIIMNT